MRSHAHVQILSRISLGDPTVFRGWVDGVDALVRCAPATGPTSDPRSAFYGGQGLLAPFRPRVHHEALAWARVEPARLLAHGLGPEGPYVALRHLPGLPLSALIGDLSLLPGTIAAVIAGVATELSALHAAGVLHRDLHPGTVLFVDGRARLAGLTDCLLDGVGPPRPGANDARVDLHALGKLARWMLGGRPLKALDSPLAEVVTALLDPLPAHRPASANAVLEALGHASGPPPALAPPHPALAAWMSGAWADRLLAQARVWDVVRRADALDLDRWGLAGLAARLLEGERGTEGWLAISTLCWRMAEHSPEPEREAYRAQATEARRRADAGWHPASRGLATLLERGEDVAALCATHQPELAARRARAADAGGLLALVGWHTKDDALVDEGLAHAPPGDRTAARVAASRQLLQAPLAAPVEAARLAFPRDQLAAVERLCAAGNAEEAAIILTYFADPTATRGRLTLALSIGDRSESIVTARALAARGHWDPTVAATLVAHGGGRDPLRLPARRLLRGLSPANTLPALGVASAAAVRADPDDLLAWSGLLSAHVATGELDAAADALATAHAGPAAWRLFVLELVATGPLGPARAVLLGAVRLFPGDADLVALDTALSLLDGDTAAAWRSATHALAQAPDSPSAWLARGAWALWTGDATLAAHDLRAAHARGAPVGARAALERCLPRSGEGEGAAR